MTTFLASVVGKILIKGSTIKQDHLHVIFFLVLAGRCCITFLLPEPMGIQSDLCQSLEEPWMEHACK